MGDEKEIQICRLSFLSQPHTLTNRDGHLQYGCFMCGQKHSPSYECHYYCTTCKVEFHRQCHLTPRKMTHPYHPQHPLTLTVKNRKTRMIADYSDKSNTLDSTSLNLIWFHASIIFDRCSWSGRKIRSGLFYRCSVCSFCLDLKSSGDSPLLTIQNPKSHHHSLVLLSRPFSAPCDACGLIDTLDPSYACFQCNYMVHKSCISLPRVIKITRHPHRLFHTPYLPPTTWLCQVCYKAVDAKYGQYSCQHEDCSYVVHSKCATYKKVWDGRELEWEPEEPDASATEDIIPFKSVGGGLIKHFSHVHHLRLEKCNGLGGEEKLCRACILPIVDSRNFYNCLQCDFCLHQVCAGLPRKIEHALHRHALVLDPSPLTDYGNMYCSVCFRNFTGFRYKCSKEDISGSCSEFSVDVRCTIVHDCFTHRSHEHPLFISTSYIHENIMCKGCKKSCNWCRIQCTLCEYTLCYRCATIPNEFHYKYDEHTLSICYGEDTIQKYWCELCEKELDPTAWFYTCNKCCVTIHRKCVFGSSVYLKSGSSIEFNSEMVEAIRNNRSYTRPICSYCDKRCVDFIYYKSTEMSFCSLICISRANMEKSGWLHRLSLMV